MNAVRLEEAFYSGRNKKEPEVAPSVAESKEQAEVKVDNELLLKLLGNPEMASLLKTLAKNL